MTLHANLADNIIKKAKSLGASIAGIAAIKDLKDSPSHLIYPKIGSNLDEHVQDMKSDPGSDQVTWPEDASTAVVIGIAALPITPSSTGGTARGRPGIASSSGDSWTLKLSDCSQCRFPVSLPCRIPQYFE